MVETYEDDLTEWYWNHQDKNLTNWLCIERVLDSGEDGEANCQCWRALSHLTIKLPALFFFFTTSFDFFLYFSIRQIYTRKYITGEKRQKRMPARIFRDLFCRKIFQPTTITGKSH